MIPDTLRCHDPYQKTVIRGLSKEDRDQAVGGRVKPGVCSLSPVARGHISVLPHFSRDLLCSRVHRPLPVKEVSLQARSEWSCATFLHHHALVGLLALLFPIQLSVLNSLSFKHSALEWSFPSWSLNIKALYEQ